MFLILDSQASVQKSEKSNQQLLMYFSPTDQCWLAESWDPVQGVIVTWGR